MREVSQPGFSGLRSTFHPTVDVLASSVIVGGSFVFPPAWCAQDRRVATTWEVARAIRADHSRCEVKTVASNLWESFLGEFVAILQEFTQG